MKWWSVKAELECEKELAASLDIVVTLKRALRAENIYFVRWTDSIPILVVVVQTPCVFRAIESAFEQLGIKGSLITPRESGSIPHARAFDLAVALHRAHSDYTGCADALHWFFNMLGFNYAGEVAFLANQSAGLIGQFGKWENVRLE